jgi:replicative DNA helicase
MNKPEPTTESVFLGSCLIDAALIDKAVHRGISFRSFMSPECGEIWEAILEVHASGKPLDDFAVLSKLRKEPVRTLALVVRELAGTGLHGVESLATIAERESLRKLKPALTSIASSLDSLSFEEIAEKVRGLPNIVEHKVEQEHKTSELCDSVIRVMKDRIAMRGRCAGGITTGLELFDREITPIEKHEYVIIGARPSVGKSSFMTSMCGHALGQKKRCVYFTLETSAESVIEQMVCQRIGANRKRIWMEFEEKQNEVFRAVEKLKGLPLMVFENDLTLPQIEARCRLLAASFKPDVVFIDYLGLIRAKGEKAYEKMTTLSKAMIPIRKSLGCALVVGAQLNRSSAAEGRPPQLTDFRDTGSIEEDAHRVIVLHRPDKDESGMEQSADSAEQLIEAYQLKLRDGPRAQGRFTFIAPHTKFIDRNG